MPDTDRAVYLTRVAPDGSRRGGSGLHVGGNLVLTADHCVDGVDHRVVTGGHDYPARVLVRSGTRDVDLAILEVPGLPPRPTLRCALIDRKRADRVTDCRALGFPSWKKAVSGRPELAEAPGWVPTAEGTNPLSGGGAVPRMSLKITAPAIASIHVLGGDLDRSEWAGMSGAVVLTEHDDILGVIGNHAQTEGVGSLGFTPLDAVNTLSGEVAQAFWSALSVGDYMGLPVLPGDGGDSWDEPLVGVLPGLPDEFVARDAIGELVTVLDESPVAVVCAVTGMRGVGKTQIARAHAQRALDAGYNLVGWIDAGTPESLEAGLADVAERVHKADPGGDSAKSVKRLREFLPAYHGRCLLVFDNATEPHHLRLWLNRIGSVKVLITSTNSAFTVHGPLVEVGTYTRAESLEFLAGRTGLSDVDGATRVADALGDLPLAIAVSAATIRERRYTYAQYLRRLSRRTLETGLPRIDGDEYPHSAWRALCLSLDETEADTDEPDRDTATRTLLGLMAVLAPDGVHRAVLDALPVDVPTEDAADLLEDAVHRCARQSVVIVSDDRSTLRMHGLMRRAVRERAEVAGDLTTLAAAANDLIRRHQFDELEAWQRRAFGNQVIAHIDGFWTTGIIEKCDRDTVADALANRNWATRQLIGAADLERGLTHGRSVVADAERLLGPDHPATLEAYHNLAYALAENNSLTPAIELHEKNLANLETILGHDHPATMNSRHSLAAACLDHDDFDKAIAHHTENLRLRELRYGPDHRDTLASRCDLSVAYRRSERKDPAEMVLRYEDDLADRERLLGAHHPDTVQSAASLAYLYSLVGRLPESISLYERTLARTEAALGSDHPMTREVQRSLAYVYRDTGRIADAVLLHETAFADAERTLGAEHRDTLRSRRELALTYRRAGRTDVLPLYEATAADCERVLGPDDPDTLTAKNNLATAYSTFGRLDDATALYETTLVARERVLGPAHPDTRQSRSNVAWAYQQLYRYDEAIDLYRTVLAHSEQSLGTTHAITLEARGDLANAFRRAGRHGEAIDLLETVVADSERTVGPRHPATMDARNRLAVAFDDGGRLGHAITVYKGTLEDREQLLGASHPDTILSRSNLASAYRKSRQFALSATLYEAVVEGLERNLTAQHADTMEARGNLAAAYRDAGQLADAESEFARLVADRTSVNGPTAPETLAARHELAACVGLASGPEPAVARFRDLIDDCDRYLGPDHAGTLRARSALARWLAEEPRIVVWLELLVAAHVVGRRSPMPDEEWRRSLVDRYPPDLLLSAVERRIRAAVDAQHPNLAAPYPPEALAAHLVDRAADFLAGQGTVCDGGESEWHTPDYLEYTEILSRSIRVLYQDENPSEEFLRATEWLNLTTTWPLIAFSIKTMR